MDEAIFQAINNRWTSPVLDFIMAALSDAEIWKPVLLIAAIAVVILGGFRARACILCLLLTLIVAEQFTSALKSTIDRRRPKQVEEVRMVEMAKVKPAFLKLFHGVTSRRSDLSDRNLSRSGPSFPSGHTTNNTVIALCLTLFYPRRGWLWWIITAAIAYSRIYLGAHWPSDVFATFFLAAGETLLMLGLFELLWRWSASRWWPRLYSLHPRLLPTAP